MKQSDFSLPLAPNPEAATEVKDGDASADDAFSQTALEMRKEIITKGKTYNDYLALQYGICPQCGQVDGRHNVGIKEYSYCLEHRLKWVSGPNLHLNDWAETNNEFYANWLYLSDFAEVEPARSTLPFQKEGDLDDENLEMELNAETMSKARVIGEYGGCPVCLEPGSLRNVYKLDYAYCPEHKTKWVFGTNNIGDWRYETVEQDYANSLYLSGYDTVESVGLGMSEKAINHMLTELQEKQHS